MRKRAFLGGLTLVAGLLALGSARAQDLVITNARVIVGNGTTLSAGSVVVREGRIQSVGATPPATFCLLSASSALFVSKPDAD